MKTIPLVIIAAAFVFFFVGTGLIPDGVTLTEDQRMGLIFIIIGVCLMGFGIGWLSCNDQEIGCDHHGAHSKYR